MPKKRRNRGASRAREIAPWLAPLLLACSSDEPPLERSAELEACFAWCRADTREGTWIAPQGCLFRCLNSIRRTLKFVDDLPQSSPCTMATVRARQCMGGDEPTPNPCREAEDALLRSCSHLQEYDKSDSELFAADPTDACLAQADTLAKCWNEQRELTAEMLPLFEYWETATAEALDGNGDTQMCAGEVSEVLERCFADEGTEREPLELCVVVWSRQNQMLATRNRPGPQQLPDKADRTQGAAWPLYHLLVQSCVEMFEAAGDQNQDCQQAVEDNRRCIIDLDLDAFAAWLDEIGDPFPCEQEDREVGSQCCGKVFTDFGGEETC